MTELTKQEAAKMLEARLRDSLRNHRGRIWKAEVKTFWGGQIEARVVLRRKRERPPSDLMQAVLMDALDLFTPTAVNCHCGRTTLGNRVFAAVRLSAPEGGWKEAA